MKLKTSLLLLFALLIIFIPVHAQLKAAGAANPDLRNALEKVITDFPKNFASLKSEVLNAGPQTVEYASLLSFKTAEQNTITLYSGTEPVYSWQALMYRNEEFEAASKKYRTLYNGLKGMSLTLNRDYTYGLSGKYDSPEESKKFSSTVFQLLPDASNLPNIKVELSMQYELLEWKIYLMVYQKEREDDERGKVKEDE